MNILRKFVTTLLVLSAAAASETALVVVLPTVATALEVRTVGMSGGKILVRGRRAAPLATITWEAQPVTTANGRGGFKFTTTLVPEDCPTDCLGMGKLSDGTEAIDVLVQFCGETGLPSGPRVMDANGQVVGVLDLDEGGEPFAIR